MWIISKTMMIALNYVLSIISYQPFLWVCSVKREEFLQNVYWHLQHPTQITLTFSNFLYGKMKMNFITFEKSKINFF